MAVQVLFLPRLYRLPADKTLSHAILKVTCFPLFSPNIRSPPSNVLYIVTQKSQNYKNVPHTEAAKSTQCRPTVTLQTKRLAMIRISRTLYNSQQDKQCI